MTTDRADPWSRADGIVDRVDPPTFPDRTFPVTEYGAIGDGETDCTDAFEDAIAASTESGGGRVVVPEGTYRTGAIHLQDGVDLHVESGATIEFSRDPEDYLPVVRTRYEGIEVENYSPLVYARDRSDVAITGAGTLDGRADEDHWWAWSGGDSPNEYDSKAALDEMIEEGVPVEERVFGDGHYLRPNMVQFYECENVLIEGVTVTNSPMWHLHPVRSENVTVREVTVDTPRGSNTDGCNPESCDGVHIAESTFDTGDDCLSFKAGKGRDGRRLGEPCENAVVEDCEMRAGNGGVVIGSETSGGVSSIFARDCHMSSPDLKRALRIKSNSERGGFVRDVHFRDISVGRTGTAIEITLDYANVRSGEYPPAVRDLTVRDLLVEEAGRALYLVGVEDNAIRGLTLTDCTFEEVQAESVVRNVDRLLFENVRL